ncbi:helix-turn-helix transcriptional regulator [Mycolicibacterium peregrinum]|uniref:helix-turn-helix transcriptional regulator n=2 Tax=Mycobacteriaceae TaxID=1762 RepID=UPI003AAE4D8A
MLADVAQVSDRESAGLSERIRNFCLVNLEDPGLCVESVASAFGVSTRLVHKVCSAEGFTLAAWVRRQRLDRIHHDLAEPSLRHRSTAAIAARWGIVDPGHLARQFRGEYGKSPSEVRASIAIPC